MQTTSRRDFLKFFGGTVAAALMPTPPAIPFLASRLQVPIPPSLMLHSPHGRGFFLANLLDALNQNNFKATTYKAWLASVQAGTPIEKPLLISIDDLTLARDVTYAWGKFSMMKETIQQAGMVATYGVITTPVIEGRVCREQDTGRWDEMVQWVEDGFELATHTSYHSCFSNKYSLPRVDFDQVDYDAEICDSAELIETEFRQRNLDYKVDTLILPYGSGYSYTQSQPAIHDGIVNACQQSNVRMVAGIPQGQAPLSHSEIASSKQLYMGRVGPLISAENKYDIQATVAELNRWSARNDAIPQTKNRLHIADGFYYPQNQSGRRF